MKAKIGWLLLAILVLFFFSSFVSLASAEETLQDHYNTGDDGVTSTAAEIWSGEAFTATATYNLTYVRLLLYKYNITSESPLYVHIRYVPEHLPVGEDICNGTMDASTLTTNEAGAWYNITLGMGTVIQEGYKYSILLNFPTEDEFRWVWWRQDQTAPLYDDGDQLISYDDGNIFWFATYRDKMFETYGETLAAPPPTYLTLQGRDANGAILPRQVNFTIVNDYTSETITTESDSNGYAEQNVTEISVTGGHATVYTYWQNNLVATTTYANLTQNVTSNINTKIAKLAESANYILISVNNTSISTPTLQPNDGWLLLSVSGSGQIPIVVDNTNWARNIEPVTFYIAGLPHTKSATGWSYSSSIFLFNYIDFDAHPSPSLEMSWQPATSQDIGGIPMDLPASPSAEQPDNSQQQQLEQPTTVPQQESPENLPSQQMDNAIDWLHERMDIAFAIVIAVVLACAGIAVFAKRR